MCLDIEAVLEAHTGCTGTGEKRYLRAIQRARRGGWAAIELRQTPEKESPGAATRHTGRFDVNLVIHILSLSPGAGQCPVMPDDKHEVDEGPQPKRKSSASKARPMKPLRGGVGSSGPHLNRQAMRDDSRSGFARQNR